MTSTVSTDNADPQAAESPQRKHASNFPALMKKQGLSLAPTTDSSGKLVFLRAEWEQDPGRRVPRRRAEVFAVVARRGLRQPELFREDPHKRPAESHDLPLAAFEVAPAALRSGGRPAMSGATNQEVSAIHLHPSIVPNQILHR
jgi:hypothetical protein